MRGYWSLFPLHWKPNIVLVNYDSWWQHQMLMRELRHDRPGGRFSKSRGLSASVSFLSSPPLPALLLTPFFSRSLTLVPRKRLLRRLGEIVNFALPILQSPWLSWGPTTRGSRWHVHNVHKNHRYPNPAYASFLLCIIDCMLHTCYLLGKCIPLTTLLRTT